MAEEIVEVWFKIHKEKDGYPKTRNWELLRCVKARKKFEVRSVPFYLKDVAYGDLVLARKNPEGHLEFESVVKRGGHSVFRLWLKRKQEQPLRVVRELLDLGLLVEWEGRLIGFAVPPDKKLDQIVSVMRRGKRSGRWGVQDGFVFEAAK